MRKLPISEAVKDKRRPFIDDFSPRRNAGIFAGIEPDTGKYDIFYHRWAYRDGMISSPDESYMTRVPRK